MSQIWTIFTALTLLAVQLCIGDKSCTISSSAGSVVQRGSSFKVYCTFNCKCKRVMYSNHPPTVQSHEDLNSTTVYLNVMNITENRTYSCCCSCPFALDPCGLDISAGYVPDQPKSISCTYNIRNNESGLVVCKWDSGRDTYLRNSSVLWVRTVSENDAGTPVPHNVSSKGTDSPSANFTMSRSVQLISVWVQTTNPLGSVKSSTFNYTVSDIVMPSTPILGQPKCFSRNCTIKVEQSVSMQYLEIQCNTTGYTGTFSPDQGVQMQTLQNWSISSLEPFTLYHFRARSKFETGHWSEWSAIISSWTQEEAPAEELDVWYTEAASDLKSPRVYWKEANISISRGKIIEYQIRIYNSDSGSEFVTNVSCNTRNYSVQICDKCEVTVRSRNSKGLSPPARITARHTKANSSLSVHVTAVRHNVTISWRKSETAQQPATYVVEWYPDDHKQKLRWVRLGRNEDHAVITDMKPFECYRGAVYAFYNENSVSKTTFSDVAKLESAPVVGPLVEEKVEGQTVKVTWTELPRSQRRGCITNYTIYLEDSSGHHRRYCVPLTERMHVIKDLPPTVYSLWMTASTAKGEGPAGQNIKILIQQEAPLFLLVVCIVTSIIVAILVIVCQFSSVKQRLWVVFQCLMLDDVPDPRNSKWAKECTQEKGKMSLELQLSNSTVTEEEEEPILVDVEELPKLSSDISASKNVSSRPSSQIGLSPESTTLLYPLTTYIKSFSHDSDSSDHTHTSLDTNTTVDYISSHGLGNMEEEDEEEEEDFERQEEMLGFFPSHNIFIEPLDFGGKLTLDAVKIDFCSDFYQDN